MNLTNFRKMARLIVPGAKISVITNTELDLVLNQATLDVARRTKCLATNETFDVEADEDEYNLSTELTRFLLPDKSGLYWYDGSDWKQVYARTQKWMDTNKSAWRDDSSGDPYYYFIKGDILTVNPPPDTDLTDGFKFHFFQKPQVMTTGSHYPFGHSSEIARLTILDEVILLYWRIEALKILNKHTEATNAFKEYLVKIDEKIGLLKERPDINAITQFQGTKIR